MPLCHSRSWCRHPVVSVCRFLSATRSVSFVSAVLLSLTFFVATQVAHDGQSSKTK